MISLVILVPEKAGKCRIAFGGATLGKTCNYLHVQYLGKVIVWLLKNEYTFMWNILCTVHNAHQSL